MPDLETSIPKANILIADDTPEYLLLLTQILTHYGYQVRSVTDGLEALKAALGDPPDIIMLDINMPNMDGIETCQRLKLDDRTSSIPVLFLSGLKDVEDKVRAFEAGGVDYVLKPFQIEEVLARLESHLSIRQLQTQLQQANQKLATRLEELTKAQLAEREQRILAETFRDTIAAINSTLNYDEVLDLILTNLRRVIPHDATNIALLDEQKVIHFKRALGYKERGLEKFIASFETPVDSFPNWHKVYTDHQSLIIPDTSQYPGWVRIPEAAWINSFACAPIVIKEKVIGFLDLDSAIPDFFKPGLAERLNIFANQAALAIEKAQLFAEANQRAEILSTLNRIGLSITSGLEMNKVLRSLDEQCQQVMPVDQFYVALFDASKGLINFPFYRDNDHYIEKGPQDIIHQPSPTGSVIRERHTIYIPDLKSPDRAETRPLDQPEEHNRSYLGVPLIVRDEVIGVISAQCHRIDAFGKDQIRLLETIATQAAIAVDNARLFTETQRLAITDGLTDVFNRRYLLELAEKEMERSRRHGRYLSAILFDLDHFKEVNDRFGHPMGDLVLKKIAELCRSSIRTTDLLGRYGGEEFLIIASETGQEQAIEIAERFRKRVEDFSLTTEVGTLKLTISLGVGTFQPGSDQALDDLIKRTDNALYVAKALGRNCVSSG
jgi:diguanylate cyclase (GGDEF)-like protein